MLRIQLVAGKQIADRATIGCRVPGADLEHSAVCERGADDAMTGNRGVLDLE